MREVYDFNRFLANRAGDDLLLGLQLLANANGFRDVVPCSGNGFFLLQIECDLAWGEFSGSFSRNRSAFDERFLAAELVRAAERKEEREFSATR